MREQNVAGVDLFYNDCGIVYKNKGADKYSTTLPAPFVMLRCFIYPASS